MVTVDANALTGLPGMHQFRRRAAERINAQKNSSFGMVYFNIANFKAYNRMHGISQGDKLLEQVASVLQQTFGDVPIGHVAADNFLAVVPKEGLFEKLEAVCNQINFAIGDSSVALKAGVYFPATDESDDLEVVFSRAKIAADDIERDATVSVRVYTDEMGKEAALRDFVLRNFDAALAAGHIQVYYQPVVRTLTEKLCGYEALARWIDPERGMISPGVFIPVLEDAKLITKLDTYMIEQVGKTLRARYDAGKGVVPVSVNLSRVDFETTDPLAVVEEVVTRYKLPRDYVHLEVTETVVGMNQSRLMKVLHNFHEAGYQVWLDDFGSEYSSLRFLHNFHFDELKIDMEFFRNFNEKSQLIIKSVVLMAKTLKMQTLAEGVETAEQVAFLKEIGCGKIQGFYFGRPTPETEAENAFEKQGYETAVDKHIFDATELVNLLTEAPTAIFYYNGRYPQMLAENAAYQAEAASANNGGISEQNALLASDDFPIKNRFERFFERVAHAHGEENMLYVDSGQYLSLTAKKIAGTPDNYVGVSGLQNITFSEDQKHVTVLDKAMRYVLSFFDGMYYFDMTADTVNAISSAHMMIKEDKIYRNIGRKIRLFARVYVYDDDRERFCNFMDSGNFLSRLSMTDDQAITDMFRVKGPDGDYHWTIYHVTRIGKQSPYDILISEERNAYDLMPQKNDALVQYFTDEVGQLSDRVKTLSERQGKREAQDADLMRALKRYSPVKLFWKDKNRRFLGASEAFLKYYGIKDVNKILGKTDEEVGWHTDNAPFKSDEEAVLATGIPMENRIGYNTRDGKPRKIITTKFPFYHGNNIVGLMGVFDDVASGATEKQQLFMSDEVTGALSYYGMVLTGLKLRESLSENDEDFATALILVQPYDDMVKYFGKSFGNKLLCAIKDAILSDTQDLVVCRLEAAYFVVFWKGEDHAAFDKILKGINDRIAGIHWVGDVPVTLYPISSVVWGKNTGGFEDMSRKLALQIRDKLNTQDAADEPSVQSNQQKEGASDETTDAAF